MRGFSLLAAIATAGMALAAPALAGQPHHDAADPLVAGMSEDDMLSARSNGFGRLSADDPREVPSAAYPFVIALQLDILGAGDPAWGRPAHLQPATPWQDRSTPRHMATIHPEAGSDKRL